MRRLAILALVLVLVLPLAACKGETTNYTSTVNFYGAFKDCPVIVLPGGRPVTFADRDVGIGNGNTISVGPVTYNVNVDNCKATTTTVSGGPIAQRRLDH